MQSARRVVLVLLVAGAGSALWASAASAGGDRLGTGYYEAGVYNVTPYPVDAGGGEHASGGGRCGGSCWNPAPANTIPARRRNALGAEPELHRGRWDHLECQLWVRRLDDLQGGRSRGSTEYVTVALSQSYTNGVYGNNIPGASAVHHDGAAAGQLRSGARSELAAGAPRHRYPAHLYRGPAHRLGHRVFRGRQLDGRCAVAARAGVRQCAEHGSAARPTPTARLRRQAR